VPITTLRDRAHSGGQTHQKEKKKKGREKEELGQAKCIFFGWDSKSSLSVYVATEQKKGKVPLAQ